MRMEQLVGERFKERPSECIADSHALMVRGGYIKQLTNGVFTLNLPMVRIYRKISEMIRREMETLGGQEVLFPAFMPEGMMHEDAAVRLVQDYGESYARYPFMVYQIQAKNREEERPRAGLIHARECTMMDAYSFHVSREDMQKYYEKIKAGYHHIFALTGIPQVLEAEADFGAIADCGTMAGGSAHKFVWMTPVGEETLAVCPECGYCADADKAACFYGEKDVLKDENGDTTQPELVFTPECKTIEDVCGFLHSDVKHSCKAVAYQGVETGEYIVVFLRGDLEVNEEKVKNAVGQDIMTADIRPGFGLVPGFMGPFATEFTGRILMDESLRGLSNVCMGGNKEDYHYVHVNMDRDLPEAVYGDFSRIYEGAVCPCCNKPVIRLERGIEVGNASQTGRKYTEPLGMEYLDENSKRQTSYMAYYGMEIGRLAASVCEAHHDEYGPIWPMRIAPWQVQICCIRSDVEEVKVYAEKLYSDLQKAGVEVLYDARNIRAGAMFSDADLLGIPLRIIVSPKNLEAGCCEIKSRDKELDERIPVDEVLTFVTSEIARRLGDTEE